MISFAIFLFSASVLIVGVLWYYFVYLPKCSIQQLISQGATKRGVFEKNPKDELFGIKKAIQQNPDVKALVRKLPGRVAILFVEPELIKEVLNNHHYYTKLSKTSELSRIFYRRGITVSEEKDWKLHRKIIGEAFHYDFLNDMIPIIMETVHEVIGIPLEQKKTIKLPRDIEMITSEAVTRIFFGMRSRDIMINGKAASEEASALIAAFPKYTQTALRFLIGMWPYNVIPAYRKLKQRIRNFRKVFGEKIQQRIQEIKTNPSQTNKSLRRRDLLEILLRHRLNHENDLSQTLSDEEILDEFSVFFLAGKDTTSLLVSMSLYCCVHYVEWGQKLREEVNQVIKDSDKISLDQLNSMDIMMAFVNEVLRMYPPAPLILPRVANRDHYVGPFFVKKGYHVNTLFIANNYNPKYFNDPEKFDPGRWLKNDDRKEGWKSNSLGFLPFSSGPRVCIGKHLALMEAKLIICLILKHFDLEIEPGFELSMGSQGIGYGPNIPIPLNLIPKE